MQKSSDFIGTEPIPSLLVRFAVPAMTSSFINCLYNIVDRLYIGRGVGPDAMAGLSLTFPYMIILASFGMMIGQGSGAIVSILLGEKRKEDANKVLGQAMAMYLLFIVTFQALGIIFLDETLRYFGATEAALPYAKDYLTIILWGNLFQHISFGMSNVMRAEGNAMRAMGVVILGAVSNIILDPIFIFGFNLGIKGAAIATILAMMISSSWVMLHFIRGGVLKLHLKYIRIYPHLFFRVLAIGISPCLMQILHSTVVIVYNHCFIHFTPDVFTANICIAAFGIINPVAMLLLTPTFGINMGLQPIIGYNTGAKLYHRVAQTLKLAITSASILCASMALLITLTAHLIAKAFTKDPALEEMTVHALRVMSAGFTFIGIGILTGTYYQSIDRAGVSIVLSVLRQGLILIPTIILFPMLLGYKAIWWAGSFSDCCSGLVCLIMVLLELKRLRNLANPPVVG